MVSWCRKNEMVLKIYEWKHMKNMLWVLTVMLSVMLAIPVSAREYVKYTDQYGVSYWVDDNSKLPPPLPVYYRYVDSNGIVFWVNDRAKIPAEYQASATLGGTSPEHKAVAGKAAENGEQKQFTTRIKIVDNQIIVPVTFRNKGRKVKARMILDTGASVTTIYSVLAADLKLHKNKRKSVKSISANGARTDSQLTKVDYIEVDDKILAHAEVVIMPSHSNIGADGLLGNSFLRFFNFTIDYENQLLRWN